MSERDVEQRPERPWREERVAGAPEDSRRSRLLLAELPDEHRLPHSRLAADEHEPPLRGRRDSRERLGEQRELPGALEELALLASARSASLGDGLHRLAGRA